MASAVEIMIHELGPPFVRVFHRGTSREFWEIKWRDPKLTLFFKTQQEVVDLSQQILTGALSPEVVTEDAEPRDKKPQDKEEPVCV